MTLEQIVAFSRSAVRRVLAYETGITPIQERDRDRLAELRRQADEESRAKEKARRRPARARYLP
jgi:methylphosphotriester-DNA--protein-cysteine methyltransferase